MKRKYKIDKLDENDEKANAASIQYITEIMSTIVFYVDPTKKMDDIITDIEKAANTVVQMTKQIYKVN